MDEVTSGAAIFALTGLVAAAYSKSSYLRNRRQINPRECSGKCNSSKANATYQSPPAIYDVIIVGAGPAGATAAYYMGKKGLRVALIDKKAFPRPKPCGDAWCKPALDILEDMNVLGQMEADGIARPVKRGGFISPFGYKCINTDGSAYGSVTGCKTYAIKRFIADEYIVKAASALPSVDFILAEVTDLQFESNSGAGGGASDATAGVWVATTKSGTLPISVTGKQQYYLLYYWQAMILRYVGIA